MSLFQPLFHALNANGVRYVVVGGLAIVLHGHARLTLDVDLVIDLNPAEARKAVEALTDLGLVPRLPVAALDFADPTVRHSWITEKNMQVFSFWDPSNPMRIVDVFAESPIPFEELWSRSESVEVGGEGIRLASLRDLIAMKRIAGRPVDLEDIEALEEIARQRKK